MSEGSFETEGWYATCKCSKCGFDWTIESVSKCDCPGLCGSCTDD